MDIKFSEIKEITLQRCTAFFEPLQFKFAKKDWAFTKRTETGALEVAFGFVNYYPVQCGYHFVIIIYIEDLEKHVMDFYRHFNLDEPIKANLAIWEGDFVKEVCDKEEKFRSGHYNIIKSENDLNDHLTQTFDVLEYKAFPLAYSLNSMRTLTEYYEKNIEKLTLNLGHIKTIVSILIATYHTDKSKFIEMFSFLKGHLEFLSSKGDVWSETIKYIQLIEKYFETYVPQQKNLSS